MIDENSKSPPDYFPIPLLSKGDDKDAGVKEDEEKTTTTGFDDKEDASDIPVKDDIDTAVSSEILSKGGDKDAGVKEDEDKSTTTGFDDKEDASGDGEFIASSVNHVDYNKLSTVLDNNNSSAGGKSIFYFQLILLCIMLIYRLLKTVYMLNVCLIIFMCIQIAN